MKILVHNQGLVFEEQVCYFNNSTCKTSDACIIYMTRDWEMNVQTPRCQCTRVLEGEHAVTASNMKVGHCIRLSTRAKSGNLDR